MQRIWYRICQFTLFFLHFKSLYRLVSIKRMIYLWNTILAIVKIPHLDCVIPKSSIFSIIWDSRYNISLNVLCLAAFFGTKKGPIDKVLTHIQKMLLDSMLAWKIVHLLVSVSFFLIKVFHFQNFIKKTNIVWEYCSS